MWKMSSGGLSLVNSSECRKIPCILSFGGLLLIVLLGILTGNWGPAAQNLTVTFTAWIALIGFGERVALPMVQLLLLNQQPFNAIIPGFTLPWSSNIGRHD